LPALKNKAINRISLYPIKISITELVKGDRRSVYGIPYAWKIRPQSFGDWLGM